MSKFDISILSKAIINGLDTNNLVVSQIFF